MESIKSKIHHWFEGMDTLPGKIVDIVIVILVFVVSAIFVIKTYPISEQLLGVLNKIEHIIITMFIIEYFLRIWSAPNRFREAIKIYSIVDLIAILPIFIDVNSYQVLRIFRALRLIRFLKESHFFYRKFNRTHLIIFRIVFIIFSIVFVSSGMIFFAEFNQQGSSIKTFFDAVYFSITTITTVGYGDITPVTTYGRLITMLIISSGIIFLPFQIKELIKQFIVPENKLVSHCNNCRQKYHDSDAKFCKICGVELTRSD